jgi:hypothetical protein
MYIALSRSPAGKMYNIDGSPADDLGPATGLRKGSEGIIIIITFTGLAADDIDTVIKEKPRLLDSVIKLSSYW